MSIIVKYREMSKAEKEKISPESPCLPHPLALPELPSFHDIHIHLYPTRTSPEYYIGSDDMTKSPHEEYAESPWLIICKPIAFAKRGEKRKWQKKNEDYGKFYCFNEIFNENLSRQLLGNKSEKRNAKSQDAARIGLFYTKDT